MKYEDIIDNSIFADFKYRSHCTLISLEEGGEMYLTGDILYLLQGDVDFSYKNFFGEELTLPSHGEPKFLTVAYNPQLRRCRLRAREESFILSIPKEFEGALEEELTILQHLYRDVRINQLFFLELYKENFVKCNFSTREQVAYFLLENAGSENRLSLEAGTSTLERFKIKRSILYRFLDTFADSGALRMKGNEIELINPSYFEDLLRRGL